MKKRMTVVLLGVVLLAVPAFAAPVYTATPTAQRVTLNGKEVDFAAYNIEGNNYFKLRDLAAAMDGTEKNFHIGYNEEMDAVEIASLTPYGSAILGGYAKTGAQQAVPSPQSMYLDGEAVTLQAYAVLDYNYCKLRDVAALLDFAVDWNPNTNTINIGTDRGLSASVTEEKIKPAATLDAETQKAIQVLLAEIGPGSKEYAAIEGHYEEKDWNQLLNDPYSSYKLSYYFDGYITHHETNPWALESFKSAVRSWLRNGGDDGVAHMEVFG